MDKGLTTQRYLTDKDSGFKYQERRHDQWKESYGLYRDKVVVNRLIQRQSVNIPLMKMTVRTLLSKFKKPSDIIFEDQAGDKQKDIFVNAYWDDFVKKARIKTKAVAEKKQVMLTGRMFWFLYVADGKANAEVQDSYDVLVDRFADPADIDGTAGYVIRQHIYKRLSDLENNPDYDREAIASLKAKYSTLEGIQQSSENAKSQAARTERLDMLGVTDSTNPAVGETLVEINEYYHRAYDEKKKRQIWHLATFADGLLLKLAPLNKVIGDTPDNFWDDHLPMVTWGDDLERLDVWSDGIADIIRTINKVLNVWFSQMIENRTLRNFGMNYFDSTANPDWVPSSVEPAPGAWLPLPGKPGEVHQRVDIPDLSESLDEMQFLITMAEQATAATATQKGTSEKSQITLGEVQMMMVEAEDRVNDMQEPYEEARLEFATKWSRLVHAKAKDLEPVTLHKKGYLGNWYEQQIKPVDFLSDKGYACIAKSKADKERDQLNQAQKLVAVQQRFPNNLPLKRMVNKQMLELINLNPEEMKEVMMFEDQLEQSMAIAQAQMPGPGVPGTGPGTGPPGAPTQALAMNPNPTQNELVPTT